ncbi:rubredoxin [Hippea maritima]|uniref:Flavin reductase domain protein FMN-binding protein n=1 Tax=Hippea maritima (strain ATCC 700847 / DSM 10411 / MH2) TaxID=760142 RepID=F2LTY8_HIPMA|nr:flavin reductase domain protein FMN-binding protein [Hippea maritima DSM 10411]
MDLKAMHKLSYGVYIVSSLKDGKYNGQIANTVFQISSNPASVAISINKQNLTHEFIEESNLFSVTVLKQETPMKFVGRFGFKSGREIDKFDGIDFKVIDGVPVVVENGVAYLIAKVVDKIDAFTHTVFVGKLIDAGILDKANPMTYAYYHEVKNGKSPKTAPTYIEEDKKGIKDRGGEMKKYRCIVCGYIYDPQLGDEENDIEPNTPFEDLPDDWTCPICGASKEDFEEVKEDD